MKKQLRNNRWVDVPCHKDVYNLLKGLRVSDTYYTRGSGEATKDLDRVEDLHRKWVNDIIDLSEFPYCYYVNGTTDAIHHWELTEDRDWQHFQGEYEYPNMIGSSGDECCVGYKESIINPNKVLYVSVPSATDGNFFEIDWIECPVILDCTYIGSTNIQHINVPKNIEQVFFSFSKGFGLIGQRVGLVYTKEPHPTLHTLKSFENWNYSGPKIIELIINNFKVDEMYNRHREKQIEICNEYGFEPSNCFFLATTQDNYYKRRRRVLYNNNARICITPLL